MAQAVATAEAGPAVAPVHALRVIEPATGWLPIGWRELWEHRELLGFLVWRDVKVRYKQTLLGAAWAVIQPLMTMVVFTVLFGRWARMPSDGRPYALFAFAALIPWTFFANAVGSSSTSLVGNTHLISKVYFPRLLVALAPIGTGLLDLGVSLAVMLAIDAFSPVHVGTVHLLALVPLIALASAIAAGVGSALAALCGLYRDVRYVVPFMTQIWMFASPVIYPLSVVPPRWRWAYVLNPMAGVIDGFRAALLGTPFDVAALVVSVAVAAVLVVSGFSYFRLVERRVADVI